MAVQYAETKKGSVISPKQDIYTTPSKAQGTFQKRGGKNVIALKTERKAAKCCLSLGHDTANAVTFF